jgi:hypothetical protein
MALLRESWLNAAVAALRPLFVERGIPLPEDVRVSCSWPTRGAVAPKNKVLGQAFAPDLSPIGAYETFISPSIADPVQVLEVVVHELTHHAVGVAAKHGPGFKRAAEAVGLTGRMTSTRATPWLVDTWFTRVISEVGPYPHAALDVTQLPKQATRLLKVVCDSCGYTMRVTALWLAKRAPLCDCAGFPQPFRRAEGRKAREGA